MKKQISLFAFIFFISSSSSYSQFEIKLNEELFLSKISDKVWVVTHYFPWESNSLIVQASDKEVVLIDTPYDTAATAFMLDWINLQLKPKKITAINTGFHIDNLGGNALLAKKGITIYGSDLTSKLIDERGSQTQKQLVSWLKPDQEKYKAAYENMVFCKPNKTFRIEKGLKKKIGELTFDVYFPGESHSPDNVVVYMNELNLLFGGCMVKSLASKNPGFTGDANMAEWPNTVRKVLNKYTSANVVVPHHGMWGDQQLLVHTIDLLKKYQ